MVKKNASHVVNLIVLLRHQNSSSADQRWSFSFRVKPKFFTKILSFFPNKCRRLKIVCCGVISTFKCRTTRLVYLKTRFLCKLLSRSSSFITVGMPFRFRRSKCLNLNGSRSYISEVKNVTGLSKKKSVPSFNFTLCNSVFSGNMQVRSFVSFFVWFFSLTDMFGYISSSFAT